jgi:hypothetical protein
MAKIIFAQDFVIFSDISAAPIEIDKQPRLIESDRSTIFAPNH